ncbi:VirB2 family type IV secretion system major pilin TrwL [Bartonella doshiae]|uniref:VirB2 family type IV secretion system major pilin TrwL n=1 Tax=Bartonella doshiae TaxID=33044 RepID=UPI0009432AB4|nr:VirB2 family type IV secretion system major pilin TrwL [Bartonella doshiae]
MKQPNILQSKASNKVTTVITAMTLFFMTHPVFAQANGLKKAEDTLKSFKDQLDIIIPIAATVILLGLSIGYAGRYIEKDTFIRWAIGVIVAGSAAELAHLLFTK